MPFRVAAAVALTFVACGGGNNAKRDAFISRGDAVCVESNAKLDALAPAAFDTSDLAAAGRAWDQILTIDREQLAGLRALAPPRGEGAEVRAILKLVEAHGTDTAAVLRAAQSGDKATFEAALDQHRKGQEPAHDALHDYGFKVCGE